MLLDNKRIPSLLVEPLSKEKPSQYTVSKGSQACYPLAMNPPGHSLNPQKQHPPKLCWNCYLMI